MYFIRLEVFEAKNQIMNPIKAVLTCFGSEKYAIVNTSLIKVLTHH